MQCGFFLTIGTKVDDVDASRRAANDVLSAVTTAINTFGTKSVTVVGHSLGAALGLLDAAFLPLHISDLTIAFYGYGLPRVRIIQKFLVFGLVKI